MPTSGSLDVVFCLDRMHFVGVVPAIRSILAHAARPEALAFHTVVGAGESAELDALLRGAFPRRGLRYRVEEFRCTPFLDDYIRAGEHLTYAAYGSSVMNFARFYLGEIYPGLGKYAYLDVDLIVQADLAELFAAATLERHDLAAVPFDTFASWEGFREGSPHLRRMDADHPVFNNGVYVTELARWRRALPELEHWMRVHRRSMEEFVFGTQSIMNLAFHGKLEVLDPEWNVNPLGYDPSIPGHRLRAGKILHWAGERKPWRPDGLYREHWLPWARDGERETGA